MHHSKKSSFLFFLIIFLLFSCRGLVNEKPWAVVSPQRINLLYIGLDNPISLIVQGVRSKDILVTVSNGCRVSGYDGNYVINCDAGVKQATLYVSMIAGLGRTRFLDSVQYRVMKVPRPVARFGKFTGGLVSKSELNPDDSVTAIVNDFVYEGIEYRITTFDFTIIPKKGEAYTKRVIGNKLDSTARNMMLNSGPGDRLVISDIRAWVWDDEYQFLRSIVLNVK